MGSKLFIEPEAQIEIEDAIEYYESQQNGLGLDFLNYLDGYFQTLTNNKATFAIKRKPKFRELPLKKYPYIIVYEVYNNIVVVYSVFNTYQNPLKKESKNG